ncbi:MAG TPA: cytochrome c biogenesis protein CcdA [Mariprofundaceae bacterium]|nr:cytochrome c biogenesis protein CcdA [Mariprofundaceae bacterium]
MIEVSFAGALLAGLLSFLSPCVLPLVPAYLSYISGVSVDSLRAEDQDLRSRAMKQSLWFILGFSLVFIALGASATYLGQWLLTHMTILGKIAGVIIFIFGLHYTGLIRIPFLLYDAHIDTQKVKATHGIGAVLLGAAFAFGWTPCVGPILGAILAMAGAQTHVSHGIILLAAYSLGLAIPFLLAAAATDRFIHWMQSFRRHLHTIEVISGILLMFVGILIFIGSFSTLAAWLIKYAPFLTQLEPSVAS